MGRPIKPQRIAWLVVLCFVSQCFATSIVTLVSEHGIVTCADGKSVGKAAGISGQTPRIANPTINDKARVIRNRFAISHTGLRGFGWNAPYSVERVFEELERDVSPMLAMASIANLIRSKLVSQFEGFDVQLTSGKFRPEHLPVPRDQMTRFTVAGYDGPTAHVYDVTVVIDWKALTHAVPTIQPVYPNPSRKRLTPHAVGSAMAITELFNTGDITFARERRAMPVEIDALVHDQDLDIAGMESLGAE